MRCRKAVSAVKCGLLAALIVGGLTTTAALLAGGATRPSHALDGAVDLVALTAPDPAR